jgi:hypothetical protein
MYRPWRRWLFPVSYRQKHGKVNGAHPLPLQGGGRAGSCGAGGARRQRRFRNQGKLVGCSTLCSSCSGGSLLLVFCSCSRGLAAFRRRLHICTTCTPTTGGCVSSRSCSPIPIPCPARRRGGAAHKHSIINQTLHKTCGSIRAICGIEIICRRHSGLGAMEGDTSRVVGVALKTRQSLLSSPCRRTVVVTLFAFMSSSTMQHTPHCTGERGRGRRMIRAATIRCCRRYIGGTEENVKSAFNNIPRAGIRSHVTHASKKQREDTCGASGNAQRIGHDSHTCEQQAEDAAEFATMTSLWDREQEVDGACHPTPRRNVFLRFRVVSSRSRSL